MVYASFSLNTQARTVIYKSRYNIFSTCRPSVNENFLLLVLIAAFK